MAASVLREAWQTFKKKHPAFEKSKKFKSDVGPQLEKFDKARAEFSALREALKKKGTEVFTIGMSVGAALNGYEEVVKELESSDKTIAADFKANRFNGFADTYVKQYKDVQVS
jgi:hypothetical protein